MLKGTAPTNIYRLSLHDALPISRRTPSARPASASPASAARPHARATARAATHPASSATASTQRSAPTRRRSEEHTSELQSLAYLVCRLLLEKKKPTGKPVQASAH